MSYELDQEEPHHVLYKAGYDHVAPALIAHELTHILRFYQAPHEERRLACVEPETEKQIADELWRELPSIPYKLHRRYVRDTARQVTATPPDIFIESYLNSRFPKLRPYQRQACEDIIFNTHGLVTDPLPRKLAPRIVYESSTALNAAYARALRELLGCKEYVRPYYGTKFDDLAKQLLTELGEDQGYINDRSAADRWAGMLGLREWYRWIPLEETVRYRESRGA